MIIAINDLCETTAFNEMRETTASLWMGVIRIKQAVARLEAFVWDTRRQ